MADRLDLAPRYREQLEILLREHVPEVEVWAYGSRVNGRSHDGSDLDLVLRSPTLERVGPEFYDLIEALEHSDIPIHVDVHDWARLPESFYSEIERAYVVVKKGSKETEANTGWREATLGECVKINDATYSPKEAWPIISYLDTGSITENRIDHIQRLESCKDKIPTRARRKVQSGEIVYSMVRPNQKHFGLLRNVPDNLLVSTGFAVLRGIEGLADSGFIYWFLSQDHIVDYLHTIAEDSTSTYPAIRPLDLEQLKLFLPPLEEQRAIADVLGALDDKIELNRRMNETLEAMARTLFKSWFVDFDPVRAKANGQPSGLPPDLDALFPASFQESELGPIPTGWRLRTLSWFANIRGGKQLSRDRFADDGAVPVLGGAGVMGFTNIHNADGYVISIGRVGAYCGRFFANRGPTWINNNASLIEPIEGISGEWLLFALRALDVDPIKKGAAQPFVSNSDLSAMKLVFPGRDVIEAYATATSDLFRRVEVGEKRSQALTSLRDVLLPRLVSGEVRVAGATSLARGGSR